MATAYLVAGLVYGDEGKGATVDFLVRSTGARLVVRYNGGAQAAHNVVTPDGRHHTFAQFGSGTFVPGVKTYLSRYMMVNPLDMMLEEAHLKEVGVHDAFERTLVDARALVTTPFQRLVNKVLLRESGKHNSCGMGIGQTREDHIRYGDGVLFVGDVFDIKLLKAKLRFLQSVSWEKIRQYSGKYSDDNFLGMFLSTKVVDTIAEEYVKWPVRIVGSASSAFRNEDVVFEGAHGVLLDEEFGEEGFNTWSKTTFQNCNEILKEALWKGDVHRVGVLRTYMTRHGDGPFLSECPMLIGFEEHNKDDGAPGKFRQGLFSFELLEKSLEICGGVDSIALNHFDLSEDKNLLDTLYLRYAPVSILGRGPTFVDRISTKFGSKVGLFRIPDSATVRK